MDSLTQVALGAAVGEAVLGKEEGNKAMLWGAIAGTIPDLDILIYPFIDEVQQLAIHRGLSHSILFAILASFPLGMLFSKMYKHSSPWKKWAKLFFWCFFTHAMLDSFTNYGTQIFYPFSSFPVSFDTIFIIDPLYTLPLLTGIIVALVVGRKSKVRRARANQIGLLVSSLYLLFTLFNKVYITNVFEEALELKGIAYQQLFSNPSPLNNVMWYGVADDGENVWIGSYSWFDEDREIEFTQVPKNEDMLVPYQGQRPIERLYWFSKGFFVVEEHEGELYFNDVRFPRSDFYLEEDGDYVFSFRLIRDPSDSTQVINFTQDRNTSGIPPGIFSRFMDRVMGNEDP